MRGHCTMSRHCWTKNKTKLLHPECRRVREDGIVKIDGSIEKTLGNEHGICSNCTEKTLRKLFL